MGPAFTNVFRENPQPLQHMHSSSCAVLWKISATQEQRLEKVKSSQAFAFKSVLIEVSDSERALEASKKWARRSACLKHVEERLLQMVSLLEPVKASERKLQQANNRTIVGVSAEPLVGSCRIQNEARCQEADSERASASLSYSASTFRKCC